MEYKDLDSFKKALLVYFIEQIEYTLNLNDQNYWYLDKAIDSVRRYESAWSYGWSDTFFDEIYDMPEFMELKDKYKDRVRQLEDSQAHSSVK